MANGIDHLGFAVEDLDEAAELYGRLLGAVPVGRDELPDTDVLMLAVGESRIELVAARGPETPVGKFLANRGPGMHHVAFAAEDVAAELARLREAGVELVDEEPRR